MLNKGARAGATIDRSQLYHLLSSGLKERWTCQFPEIPRSLGITLLHLGLRPIGKGALVVTGGPMGTGADGRSRRLEVGLCIMWPAIAVTVSLLSLSTEGGPIPTAALICRLDTVSPPPPFPESSPFSELRHHERWLCRHVFFILRQR